MEGEPLVYVVRSASRPSMRHRVDLSAFCGNGQCGCEHFEMRLRGALLKRAMPDTDWECKHIRAARRYHSFQCLQFQIDEIERQSNEIQKQEKARALARHAQRQTGGSRGGEADEDDETPF